VRAVHPAWSNHARSGAEFKYHLQRGIALNGNGKGAQQRNLQPLLI